MNGFAENSFVQNLQISRSVTGQGRFVMDVGQIYAMRPMNSDKTMQTVIAKAMARHRSRQNKKLTYQILRYLFNQIEFMEEQTSDLAM